MKNGQLSSTPLQKMTDSPFIVFGSGAMACFLAARLSFFGHKVCLVDDWVAGMQRIREKGITLKINDEVVHQNMMTILPGEPIPTCQQALVLVKSWQTVSTARRIYDCLAPEGMALTLQNGLGNDLILKQILGENRVAVGVTTLGATLISQGNVIGFDHGSTSVQDKPGIQKFLSIFESAKLKISAHASIDSIIWEKLVMNAAINPLTAILGIPNGKLLETPPAFELMEQIAAEAVKVSTRLGISLPYVDPMQQITAAIQATVGNYSSMFQDIQRGAPTEIDQINGAIVQLGQQNGIPTPYNQCIIALVKSRVSLNTSR
jgi:2-dehydropantoate 2-reductase